MENGAKCKFNFQPSLDAKKTKKLLGKDQKGICM